MDILSKLSEVTDPDLQALLAHSVRYSLQHSTIATQAEATKNNPQAQQAAVIHRDTANLMNLLVEKILELQPTPKVPAKRAAKKK